MSDVYYQNFLTSGLVVLIGAVVMIAWSIWRLVDRQRDMEQFALDGIAYEQSAVLLRVLNDMAVLKLGEALTAQDLIPLRHPQFDALLAGPVEIDRRPLTDLQANYEQLDQGLQLVRTALAQGKDVAPHVDRTVDAAIEGLTLLYLWDVYNGKAAHEAPSTRSWHVRDWMKATKFHANMVPGLHLRDEVVERLRVNGMTLTPKPLDHTAHEYFSKRYDRKADPNAPFWKRRQPKPEAAPAEETPVQAEPIQPDPVQADPVQTDPPLPAPESAPTPRAAPDLPAQPQTPASPEPQTPETPQPVQKPITNIPQS